MNWLHSHMYEFWAVLKFSLISKWKCRINNFLELKGRWLEDVFTFLTTHSHVDRLESDLNGWNKFHKDRRCILMLLQVKTIFIPGKVPRSILLLFMSSNSIVNCSHCHCHRLLARKIVKASQASNNQTQMPQFWTKVLYHCPLSSVCSLLSLNFLAHFPTIS